MRNIEELSEDSCLEKRWTRIKDDPKHSLTTEERDEIVRKYNAEHSGKSVEGSKDTQEVRESKERHVRMWSPQIRGTPVDSEEKVLTILQDLMPGIFKHRRFEIMMNQISMHMKVIQEFGNRELVTPREIRNFANQNDYNFGTIEAWVLQKKRPKPYQLINENALTKERAEVLVSAVRERIQGLDTRAKLDLRLDFPYHETRTKRMPKFWKDYDTACKFYEFLDELVDGGILGDIASRVGIKSFDALQYLEHNALPQLIGKVLNLSVDEIKRIEKKSTIKDEAQYDLLLSKNPQIRDYDLLISKSPHIRFSNMDLQMRGYLRLKEMQKSGTLPYATQEKLAERFGFSVAQLNLYLQDKSAPRFQSILLQHESSRVEYEESLPSLAFENRIEPELTFKELHQFKDLQKIDAKTLGSSLSIIYKQSEISSKVKWLDLHICAPWGQEWFKQIISSCRRDRIEIERILNQKLGFDKDREHQVRLGVVSSRIYLRLEDTLNTNFMTLHNDEMFQFHDLDRIDELLSRAKASLGIKSDSTLSRLIHQISDYDKSETSPESNTSLYILASYVRGSTLSFLLDSCDMTPHDIRDDIASIRRFKGEDE